MVVITVLEDNMTQDKTTTDEVKKTEDMTTDEVMKLRDLGNSAFKSGDMNAALDSYTRALETTQLMGPLKATLHRNRAAVRLKLQDARGSEDDCTIVLDLDRSDAKALYRRALARQQLENLQGAFADAKEALRLVPNDKDVTELLRNLVKASGEQQEKALSIESRVGEMRQYAFNTGEIGDLEKQTKALNNLLVVARETETGAQRVWNEGLIVPKLLSLIRAANSNENTVLAAVRTLDELIKNPDRCIKLIETMGMADLCRLMCARPDGRAVVASAGLIVQRVFNSLARMDRNNDVKPNPDVVEANKVHIIRLLLELGEMLTDRSVGLLVRDTIIDLLVKNLMHMNNIGLPRGWSWRFVEERGLLKLLDVACQIPEQCTYAVSTETRQHLEVCLAKLDEDMVFDTKRAVFKQRVDQFFNEKLAQSADPAVRVQLCSMLTTLLQGAVDVGVSLVAHDKVTAIMLEMASSDSQLHQSVAAELLVRMVSKRERAAMIVKIGVPILKKLFDSEDQNVKVRALMGLCKCASAGGDDISLQTMQEGSTLKLAQTCKKFILDTQKYPSVEVRRLACEALSYLSLDADVKEWIVDDSLLIRAIVHLATQAGPVCVYAVASIFVNLSNAYDRPKTDPEMVKLAQFAKHHVPEMHEKDADGYIKRRIGSLLEEGAASACVAVGDTRSENCLELLARCLCAFTSIVEQRGRMLKEGVVKLLLHLCQSATPDGRLKAAQALARLGLNIDPKMAFPGQRAYELVRPMISLLHPDVEGAANYEALMTLTNLASSSESIRQRILKEKAVPRIEEYWFMTDQDQLRAAAAELLLNLLYSDEFFEQIARPGTDKLKVWPLYAAEDDDRLAMASAAGFAILTTNNADVSKRIVDELNNWPDLFSEMCMRENVEIQRRCLMAIANMCESDQSVCARIMQTGVFRLLVAITKLDDDSQKTSGEDKKRFGCQIEAKRALDAAEKLGFIVATDRELYERQKQQNAS